MRVETGNAPLDGSGPPILGHPAVEDVGELASVPIGKLLVLRIVEGDNGRIYESEVERGSVCGDHCVNVELHVIRKRDIVITALPYRDDTEGCKGSHIFENRTEDDRREEYYDCQYLGCSCAEIVKRKPFEGGGNPIEYTDHSATDEENGGRLWGIKTACLEKCRK